MRKITGISAFVIASMLGGCASAPPPPTVDGTHQVPINSASTVSNLQEQAKAPPRYILPAMPNPVPSLNVVTVHFPYNVTKFDPSPKQKAELAKLIPHAWRVEIRGRTDGHVATARDEQVALGRADAARTYLVAHGLPAQQITVNYVSAGDFVGNNQTAIGRKENRRVEILFFNH